MEKTKKVFEQDLREQIAQEIEAFKDKGQFHRGFPGCEEEVLDIAASIARGNK